jgi:hypothetical protein
MTTIFTEPMIENKFLNLDMQITEIKDFIIQSARDGSTVTAVERELYRKVFEVGFQALKGFFDLHGNGDIGESLVMPDGHEVKRLDDLRQKNYRSVFGTIILNRAVYGTRQKCKLECIPLDAKLQLPQSEQSHVLQEISQFICMEMSYKKGKEAIERFLPIKVTIDTLERTTRDQSNTVSDYREIKPTPDHDEEGELLIVTADSKGIPIKQQLPSEEIKIEEHQFKKGPKPGRKRMAVVGAVYSIDRYVRNPEEIVQALFRENNTNNNQKMNTDKNRPVPENKEIIAHLDTEVDGVQKLASDQTFQYLSKQACERFDKIEQELIFLIDGQPSLWEQKKKYFGSRTGIEILDLLHVNGYLWDIANLIHPDDKCSQIKFMKNRLLKILQGDIGRVMGGFQQTATKLNFSKTKKEKLDKICNYFRKNKKRMRYDLFLEKGYPIATGIIEGACRHYIKDRMERSGMRWTMSGAQAMLDMRSIFINGDWAEFQNFRVKKEAEILYPYKSMFEEIKWPLAA